MPSMHSRQHGLPPSASSARPLGHISVHSSVVCVPFQELTLDERLDSLFNDSRARDKAGTQLLCHFSHNAVVVQHSPGLQDSNNGCLYKGLPVLLNLHIRGHLTTLTPAPSQHRSFALEQDPRALEPYSKSYDLI